MIMKDDEFNMNPTEYTGKSYFPAPKGKELRDDEHECISKQAPRPLI